MNEDLKFVRESIHTLAEKFESNPTLFFNESDLQADLFALLLSKYNYEAEIQNISVWGTEKPKPTQTVYSRRLHSELLLPEGRIDLAILDLINVRFAINSKGRFGHIQLMPGNHIFIEIKASRTNRSHITSRNRWFQLILADINKLNHYDHPCFLVCFDFNKYSDNNSIAQLRQSMSNNLELFYFSNNKADNYFVS